MKPGRVLVVRVGAMGDVLHALPAVAALRQQQPHTEIDWVADTRWAPLLAQESGPGPVVSHVCLADTRLWSRAPFSVATAESIRRLRQTLRRENYDHVVDLQGTLRSAVIARFPRNSSPAGFADPREAAARMFYGTKQRRRGVHVVDQGAALLGDALGLSLAPVAPALPRDAAAEAWAADLVLPLQGTRRLAVLAPTAGWGAKQWPAARFAMLARALYTQGWTVLINAATANDPTCGSVVQVSEGAATLVPCSLVQLIALLRRADLVVGGDSGPVHLAAALSTPLVALFGPTDPARNGPWGPGPHVVLRDPSSVTHYKRIATTDPGLERISVPQVFEAVLAVSKS